MFQLQSQGSRTSILNFSHGQLTEDDDIFKLLVTSAGITQLVTNPVELIKQASGKDFRALGCPDVTILFSFSGKPAAESDEFVVEGAFSTNVITVRAGRVPGVNRARFLESISGSLLLEDSPIHIGIGPAESDFYAHYQLGGDLADARIRVAAFVLNPERLMDEMTAGRQVTRVDGKDVPVEKNVRFALPGKGDIPKNNPAQSLSELRFIYQWLDETENRLVTRTGANSCSCNKVRAVSGPDTSSGGGMVAVVDTIVSTTYLPCPVTAP